MSNSIPNIVPKKKRASPDDQDMVDAIAEWHATPESFREHKSLKALAESLDWPVSDKLYRIANSAEVAHRSMIYASALGINRAGEVMNMLADKAVQDGSVRAAEVWLQHNRTLLTDEKLMKHIGAKANPQELMTAALDGAKEILEFVGTLNNDKTTTIREVVDVEWEDTTNESESDYRN
jgi:hypothetical protein